MTTQNLQDDRSEAADERRVALSLVLNIFAEASLDGLAEDSLTQAAIFVAFQKLVAGYGEEEVAAFAARLPERIRNGEFSTACRH